MSSIGSPLHTSLVQTAQAQKVSSAARDKEKADTDRSRRTRDLVELRVAGLESADALRQLPGNDSEQAHDEHERSDTGGRHPEPPPRIDLTA
ncbi:MAG: hypothetical protein ACYTG1_02740 [Planctomycetota bacterium]|jgi:hypothetical protein